MISGVSVSCPVQSDWPKALWQWGLPDDVIPSNEGDVPIVIEFDDLREEVSVAVCSGRCKNTLRNF